MYDDGFDDVGDNSVNNDVVDDGDLVNVYGEVGDVVNDGFVDTRQVLAMVEGRDRRPELGYKLAMELKNAMDDNQ